ncbi:plasmid mobilization protein [Gordonibacter urolithinfaciens]|uniref:plasmid mobilization protein n=1 Tax=Gordonibacter urolithinfaciens TaxID=1335613 RepID=UPI000F4C9557|nr:plasmid mobilization relaxosome protein MobC [Gordonibacter urolithinfaciens]ROT90105.1 hypothetical protein DMP13_09550 [Gordonibacter urolithinfaciens]
MRENKTEVLRIRMTSSELDRLRSLAEEAGCSVSEYARQSMFRPNFKLPKHKHIEPINDVENSPRSGNIHIRFTLEERAWIEQRANWMNCTPSALVRRMIFTGDDIAPIVIDTSLLKKTYLELNRQGTNLNQLMTYLNTYKSNADTNSVSEALDKVSAQLDHLNEIVNDLKRQERSAKKRIHS